jgi:antitoxin component YwqK of YwqJK toxin-antitoxin module
VHRWIEREPLESLRWRFTADGGKSLHGEIWFSQGAYASQDAWERRIAGLSGQLEISVPVRDQLPWYRKPPQSYRLERRVPYRNGLIHGSVIHCDPEGHETSIQQYRDGKQDGIYCFFNADGSFSHFTSFKNGVMDGPCISCWTNGLLCAADLYSKGQRNGLARQWSRTAQLREEGSFAAYKPTGKHTFWFHHNGAKSHEIQYSEEGVPIDTTIWAADGICIGTGTYKDGRAWDGYIATTGKGSIYLGYFSGGQCLKHHLEWLKENKR